VSSSAYYDLRAFPKDDKARFVESVTRGKRQMPAWEGIVKPEQVEAIWAYIGKVNGW
jgi:cytochrome c55X